MQVLLAGTLAEEIIFQDISTGAQNDLGASERDRAQHGDGVRYESVGASELSRKWSFSVLWAARRGEPYSRDHSEQTAREIDEEVKRIIDEMAQRARQVLAERKQALENITKKLIEVEIIDNSELSRLVDETLPGPRVVPGTQSAARNQVATAKPEDDRPSIVGDAVG